MLLLLHPLAPWRHRSATKSFQALLSKAIRSRSFHVIFVFLISVSSSRLHVFLGRPFPRFPWGFQYKTCLVMLSRGFLNVWPNHLHFLFCISCSIGCCPVLSHSSSFVILSDQCNLRMMRKHLLMNTCSFLLVVLVVRHVSEPYKRTDLTFELKILIFVPFLICPDFQIFFRVAKAPSPSVFLPWHPLPSLPLCWWRFRDTCMRLHLFQCYWFCVLCIYSHNRCFLAVYL